MAKENLFCMLQDFLQVMKEEIYKSATIVASLPL
jgi:hypothetical protein